MFEIGQCDDVDHPTQMHLYCATEKILKAMGYRVEVGGRGCQKIFFKLRRKRILRMQIAST